MSDVAFQGERTLELHGLVDGQASALKYTEAVASNGLGQFSAIPTSILEPSMSDSEREMQIELLRARQSFHYRFRDWQIRDVGLFQMNYSIEDLGAECVVAGRTCQQFIVRRLDAGLSETSLSVDPETGIVLAFVERDALGSTISASHFTSFALGVDASSIEWAHEPFVTTEVPEGNEAQTIGFEASRPQIIPAGFRLQKTESFVADGRRWARRVYSDGVEVLLFLHGKPLANAATTPAGQMLNVPGQQIHIRWRAIGPWILAECRRQPGETIILMGRASKDSILEALKSAVH